MQQKGGSARAVAGPLPPSLFDIHPPGQALNGGAGRQRTGPALKYENTWYFQREAPAPATLDVTGADLAEIKAAVLRHNETREPGSVGMFELTLQDGRLVLIRQPPFTPPLLVYFGFYLAKVDGRWVVLDDYLVEERISEVEEE